MKNKTLLMAMTLAQFIDQYTTWKDELHGVIAKNMREQSRYRFRLFKYAALGE